MIDTNGIIRSREKITLNKTSAAAVVRLYDDSVLTDTVVEEISYLSEGLEINGYITRPKSSGPFPVLIWNRGGSGDKGALTDLNAFLVMASTAVWGYVVLGTQYRGNMGSEGIEDWGGSDLTDALNMLKVAENIPEADLSRVAIEGPSRGGMTTYRAIHEYRKFKCGIVHAGVTDVIELIKVRPDFGRFIERRFGHLPDDQKQSELKKISAVHFARELPKDVPLLIMHGDNDTVIPIEQSYALVEELKKYNIPHEFIVLPGGTHVALKDGSYKEIDRHRKAWMERYL